MKKNHGYICIQRDLCKQPECLHAKPHVLQDNCISVVCKPLTLALNKTARATCKPIIHG